MGFLCPIFERFMLSWPVGRPSAAADPAGWQAKEIPRIFQVKLDPRQIWTLIRLIFYTCLAGYIVDKRIENYMDPLKSKLSLVWRFPISPNIFLMVLTSICVRFSISILLFGAWF